MNTLRFPKHFKNAVLNSLNTLTKIGRPLIGSIIETDDHIEFVIYPPQNNGDLNAIVEFGIYIGEELANEK